ncbi:MarR family winged helix-turn-helix transcriptional regulator [Kitasatospora purpeofusca]|uniref:MarR family winged helix-turn-helix transcriptional regulator n=1 Tax=Kitasatospora purpeofusca TaxID=67352 RepID=A0ABZ1TXF6_9ACTN|nr:MarR family winged helix-turn-helix transcriptional regulator [Kitasatospora purpeofusca]MCX4689210.1 MarR family winged helix-turn-helix transcriptional regulator [Kitasatospora purpeofusca]WSR43947.1 MarR family winged helix-turn-helix transcriptional regulator [Kitasatospora purpeofusca]
MSARLQQSPGHLIRVAQQVHTRLWSEHVGADLTAPQFAVLLVLALEPGADQRTVGERASLDKATMAEMVARLVRRGLVLRRRDPADGRRKLLALSQSGAQAVREATGGVVRVQRTLFEPLTSEEQLEIVRVMAKIARLEPAQVAVLTDARPMLDAQRAIGYLIRVSQQVHTKLWSEHVGSELTAPQYAVLDALELEPGADQRTVGELASLDKATMAEMVSRLVRRGLVQRRRDPSDGRRNLLSLSPAGQDLLHRSSAGVAQVQRLLLAPLEEHEHEAALALIAKAARL